ncbi:rod shape-determining protein [Desulfurivibrio sp. D14AmB]|uniref:rod shape-determining protein n=1 Tax=Desulfurivibrio sp. D14AmB TaxID=3374370 RepID=UPI00376F3719
MPALLNQILARPAVAIDLGTANTRVASADGDRLVEGPSLIRHVQQCRPEQGEDEYISYINNKLVSSPLRGGVIIDVRNAANLIRPLLKKAAASWRAPLVLSCAPTDSSDNERRFLVEAISRAGAKRVVIIPEVWAAALGAGINVDGNEASLLLDIGEGVTDMAVIRERRVVFATAVRTACADLQRAVRNVAIIGHRVSLYPHEVQRLTQAVAGRAIADEPPGEEKIKVMGMGIVNSREVSVEISQRELIGAMEPVLGRILLMIEVGLRRLSPELTAEIARSGICLSGGGACIRGMDAMIARRTGLAVRLAPEPLNSVIDGARSALGQWRRQDGWWKKVVWPNIPQVSP